MHDAYMRKRIPKGPKPGERLRPLYQKTHIKGWREYREMSQEELAEKVAEYLLENEISQKGYTYASIGRMENGRIPYSQPILEGISKTLGVSVAMLITTPAPKPGEPLPPEPEMLLRLWNAGVNASGNIPPSAIPGSKAQRTEEIR